MPAMRVLVVGAGLAGLSAAKRLHELGLDVTVLEARRRVGGRVWSHRFDNGAVVELGGEWIDSSQETVTALAERLELSLVKTGQDFVTRDLLGADPIPDEHHRALAERLTGVISDLGEEAETRTIAEVLDTVDDLSPAMAVLRSRLEGTFAAPLAEVSATDLSAEFGLGQASTYVRVAGGNDRLAMEMARDLEVRLGEPVGSVAQGVSGVTIGIDGRLEQADLAVLAVPLPVLRSPGFLDDPPPDLRAALGALGMGTAVKVSVATVEEPPMFRRQEPDIPGWYWTGGDGSGHTRRAVTGFAGTHRGAATLAAEASGRLAAAAPEVELAGEPIVVDWGSDPWARGCYSALGPGQRSHLARLAEPWGRVLFAGEHVNGTGTIDGAIRSGLAAAERLVERV